MPDCIEERVRRGIRLRVLGPPERDIGAIRPTSTAENRELRYAPDSIKLGMSIYIHDEKVLYISSKQKIMPW